MTERITAQHKEIIENGVLNTGYASTIFKDENFDTDYMFDLLQEHGEIKAKSGYDLMTLALDLYISEITDEEFEPLAKYFFNHQ